MRKARGVFGVTPIYASDVFHFSFDHQREKNYSDDKLKYDTEFGLPREFLAEAILEKRFRFHRYEIEVKSVWFSKSGDILYIETNEADVPKVFGRMAKIQDHEISVRNYTPTEAMERKKALDVLCTKYRDEHPGVRTNIRPGKTDFEIFIKTKPKSEFEYWTKIDLNEVDPTNSLPPFKPKGETPSARNANKDVPRPQNKHKLSPSNEHNPTKKARETSDDSVTEESGKERSNRPTTSSWVDDVISFPQGASGRSHQLQGLPATSLSPLTSSTSKSPDSAPATLQEKSHTVQQEKVSMESNGMKI